MPVTYSLGLSSPDMCSQPACGSGGKTPGPHAVFVFISYVSQIAHDRGLVVISPFCLYRDKLGMVPIRDKNRILSA